MADNQQYRRDATHDPTRVREQPQLTSASGATWLVVAAISTLLLGGMLVVIDGVNTVSVSAGVLMVVLFVSMVIVRMLVKSPRLRLPGMAALYVAILAVATVATFVTILVP